MSASGRLARVTNSSTASSIASGPSSTRLSPSSAERTLTRAHDAQLGPGVEQLFDEIGDRVDDVLAVVEHDDGRVTPHPLDERVGSAGDAQRRDDRVDDLFAARRRLEPDEPRPAGWMQRLRHGDRSGRLADAARPDDRDEAFCREAATDLVEVVVSPDERRGQRRQVAAAPGRRERVVVREDAVLEVAQLGSGFEPELVDEERADACAGGQTASA